MFFYLYDKLTTDKKYEGVLTRVENRLIDLGINGRIERMSLFKNMHELIEDAIKREAHTVVAVGDDHSFLKAVSTVAPFPRVALGFIPVVEESIFGRMFGIPMGEGACDALSKRLTLQIDLGRIHKTFFLTSIELPKDAPVSIQCDRLYTVSALKSGTAVRIDNLGPVITHRESRVTNVRDGRLEVVLTPATEKKFLRTAVREHPSVFPVGRVKLTAPETLALQADGATIAKTPCEIEVVPKGLKVIVGKERLLP